MGEQISRLMDGELEGAEADAAFRELKGPDGVASWVCYHVIGDTLRRCGEPTPGFSARFAARLEAEPTVLAPRPKRAPTTTGFDNEEAEGFEDAEQLRDSNTPESELEGKEIAATVNRAMDALPADLRTAITLREIEGLSYEEIASVMNCPVGTVRSRIFRARDAIAAELRPLLGTDKDRRW